MTIVLSAVEKLTLCRLRRKAGRYSLNGVLYWFCDKSPVNIKAVNVLVDVGLIDQRERIHTKAHTKKHIKVMQQ